MASFRLLPNGALEALTPSAYARLTPDGALEVLLGPEAREVAAGTVELYAYPYSLWADSLWADADIVAWASAVVDARPESAVALPGRAICEPVMTSVAWASAVETSGRAVAVMEAVFDVEGEKN